MKFYALLLLAACATSLQASQKVHTFKAFQAEDKLNEAAFDDQLTTFFAVRNRIAALLDEGAKPTKEFLHHAAEEPSLYLWLEQAAKKQEQKAVNLASLVQHLNAQKNKKQVVVDVHNLSKTKDQEVKEQNNDEQKMQLKTPLCINDYSDQELVQAGATIGSDQLRPATHADSSKSAPRYTGFWDRGQSSRN